MQLGPVLGQLTAQTTVSVSTAMFAHVCLRLWGCVISKQLLTFYEDWSGYAAKPGHVS